MMEHAEAHELLADLALEPSRLTGLERDDSAETEPLRVHVAGCATCTAEIETWRRTWSAFGDARAAGEAPRGDLLRAPASVRAATLAAIAGPTAITAPTAAPAAPVAASRRWSAPRGLSWLAVAAALVIAIGAGSLAWVRTSELDRSRAEAAELAEVAATMDRVLADPVHWVTPLSTVDGAPGGTLAWSNSEIVVISAVLPAPEPGQTYRCWVERAGKRSPIGAMEFTGGTGYWAGVMTGWDGLLTHGARFGVSLVPAAGGEGAPVLIGSI
jgi:hypothetical protein